LNSNINRDSEAIVAFIIYGVVAASPATTMENTNSSIDADTVDGAIIYFKNNCKKLGYRKNVLQS